MEFVFAFVFVFVFVFLLQIFDLVTVVLVELTGGEVISIQYTAENFITGDGRVFKVSLLQRVQNIMNMTLTKAGFLVLVKGIIDTEYREDIISWDYAHSSWAGL